MWNTVEYIKMNMIPGHKMFVLLHHLMRFKYLTYTFIISMKHFPIFYNLELYGTERKNLTKKLTDLSYE